MENKYRIIPTTKFIPFTLDDLSVVIPQASQYVRRLKWFIPQYIKATPQAVINNTVVVYDPEDLETKAVLDQYLIKGITTTPPHSTYKLQAGFASVKTRLVARMHNDAFIKRSDWAIALVEHFNTNPATQLVGALNISGGIGKDVMDRLVTNYPAYQVLYDKLQFSEGPTASIAAPFFSAHCMVGQTYLLKVVHDLMVDLNQGNMNKEDVLTTILANFLGAKIISWTNMYSFVANVGAAYGDFDDNTNLPIDQIILTEEQRKEYFQAEFKEANG